MSEEEEDPVVTHDDRQSGTERKLGTRALSRRTLLRHAGVAGGATALAAAPTTAFLTRQAAAMPSTQAAVKRGGTLTWAYSQIPLKLDPVWTQARTDTTVLTNVVETLVRASEDASAVEPAVAESWDESEDGLSYTFHLRPGLQFHNGKAVTADDVVASLGRAKTMGVYQWSLAEVDKIEKVDDATVKITLTTVVASFLARIAMMSNAIFPAELIAETGEAEITSPIGTGPFKVTEWVPNDHLTLDKYANHWEMGEDGQALPYLDQVLITEVVEPTTQVLQIQAGQLNGTEGLPFSQIPELENNSSGKILLFPQQQVYFMVVQLTRPPFDDVKVRQAMSLALDRQVFVDRVTSGKAEVANSFMPKSGMCWNADAVLPYDPERAKSLIAESTYPSGHKGAKLQVPSGSQLGRDNAVIAQQMWGEIGIELEIEEIEGSTLADNWYQSNYEAISGYQWTNGMMDPEQIVEFFFVEPRMNTGYQPAQHALDLVDQASVTLDPDARCAIYYELQNTYNEDVGGTISLYFTPSVNYVSPNVEGFIRTPLGVPLWRQTWLTG
jgi:peptide/nickel transport system substrate-binding protein